MTLAAPRAPARARWKLHVSGPVQGVGFRPDAHRLAQALDLGGWVANTRGGVRLEIEGREDALRAFEQRLRAAHPGATIDECERTTPSGEQHFVIRPSLGGTERAAVPADVATCADCLAELFDARSRRFHYPFITCARCGPRQSIVRALPYDRRHTTMTDFTPCAACRAEYDDPDDRRFHAQTNACAACGPRLVLHDHHGTTVTDAAERVLAEAVAAIGRGRIVAVKGIGGFHLIADATNEQAVRRLRARKARPAKPFAVMAPHLDWARDACAVGSVETAALTAPEAPIVLLGRRMPDAVAPSVAPDTPILGVMLPYAPVHHLLTTALGRPLVATSGNHAGAPLCATNADALTTLAGIADAFVVHDRTIVTPLDDSIVRVFAGRPCVLRRARGYAATPIPLPVAPAPIIGLGAHLKATVAVPVGRSVYLSPHIGDLDDPGVVAAHEAARERLCTLYDVAPHALATDLHPDSGGALAAERTPLPVRRVQHHEAHVRACMADAGIAPPVLGIAWDGLGLGPDGVLWGGELLRIDARGCRRVAHLRPFALPGGERAVREGRRAALGLLWALDRTRAFVDETPALATFPVAERAVVERALTRGVNTPTCTSAGRLIDAVASLLDLRHASRFEGDAAMALEYAAADVPADRPYPIDLVRYDATTVLDWEPLVRAALADHRAGVPTAQIAARVLEGLAGAAVAAAVDVGEPRVALTGGCFQNARLLESTVRGLRAAGLEPFWHQHVPPNDGGIALGQVLAASATEGA